MARLPILDEKSVRNSDLLPVFEGMREMGLEKFMNQIGVLAHHGPLAQAIFGVLKAYYFESVVPRKYLEISILLVSVRNRCNYCVVHHAPPALDAGLTLDQLAAIENDAWEDDALFDAVDMAVLRYTDRISTHGGRMKDETYEVLREHFDEKQVVELTIRAAMCEFFNRFNEAFQIDMEPVAEMMYRTAMKSNESEATETMNLKD